MLTTASVGVSCWPTMNFPKPVSKSSQAGRGRREKLATARRSSPRSSPLAEGDPRCHVHQWDRGRQPRSSTRCRLTPPVTNFRQYLVILERGRLGEIGGGRPGLDTEPVPVRAALFYDPARAAGDLGHLLG